MKRTFLVICLLLFGVVSYGAVESFDDIDFWVGEGSSRAAFVVDWHDQCLVWGYKWDGDATGADMLNAICQADTRLYSLSYYSGSSLGSALGGIGYDSDNDGFYGVTNGSLTYNQDNIVGGSVSTNTYDFDDWTSVDSDDNWFSGWYSGYWSYWLSGDGANWGYSGVGMSGRVLTDGCWDGWGWADFADYGYGSAPSGMVAAVPEPATLALLCFGALGVFRKRS